MARTWTVLIAAWALCACSKSNGDALPFRAMTVSMQTTTQGAADASVEIASAGKITTSDPTLECTMEAPTSAWSRSIRCDRDGTSIASSFDCPITGTKVGASGGALTIGNTRNHVVHQFTARCEYGTK